MDAREIYLAGGCFWGTDVYLKKLPGIIDTEVGYVNANIENPSYEDVCTGATNAAEAVKVTYDADVISPSLLLQAYLRTINPFSLNRQGNDVGTQYRTGIYWTDPTDAHAAESLLMELARKAGKQPRVEAGTARKLLPCRELSSGLSWQKPFWLLPCESRGCQRVYRRARGGFRGLKEGQQCHL